MSISGSDPALMRAQSGIIRSGASRSGYYTPFAVKITIKGTDWTSSVDKRSISVEQELGGSTAKFTTLGIVNYGLPPALHPEYGEVVITTGSSANRLFAGYIMQPTLTRRRANARTRIEFGCVDYSWLLDRYPIVGKRYDNRGVMTILGDLLYQLPSGQRKFTPDSDGCSYSNIDFQANHSETIASAINRLASRLGAQWYVDAYKVVHLYVPGSQTGVNSATELSDSSTHFWGLSVSRDPSQARTRIHSQGARTQTAAAAAPGDTTLTLDDTSKFGSAGGELLCGANYLTYTGKTTTTLTGIPASGTGAILYPIPIGEDARILAIRDDASAQTALATAIGDSYLATDDGVVTHVIEDGSASDAEARANGDGELDLYASIPTSLNYLTRDMRAAPGRTISTASLTLPWTLSSTYTIRSVTLTGFGQTNKRPLRQVSAGGYHVDVEQVMSAGLRYRRTGP